MLLVLLRHGIAEERRKGLTDHRRALTPRGVERTTKAVHGLAKVIDRPDVILTSPKTRALQTAAIAADTFDIRPEPVDAMAEGPADQVILALRSRTEGSAMLVGHEPWMSELVEKLCAPQAASWFIDLKKAGAAVVDAPVRRDETPGPGVLHQLLTPRALRAMAGSGAGARQRKG